MTGRKQLTTAHGNPIGDNQNSMAAGQRGPLLLQDYQLLEKMATFEETYARGKAHHRSDLVVA